MKHLILALIVLCIVVGGVVTNSIFVQKTVAEISADTSKLPETADDFAAYEGDIQDFVDMWYSHHAFLSLSLHMTELERGCDTVAKLAASFESGSYSAYISAKRSLEALIAELADGEKLNFSKIF